jgi:hypothetical protein
LSAAARPQENFVSFIERVMRAMTHINIGAALGLAAWVLWSGWQVVTGQIAPTHHAAQIKALMSLAHAGEPSPMHIVPVHAGAGALPPCHTTNAAPAQAAVVMTGADL